MDKVFSVWHLVIPEPRLKWKTEVLLPPHPHDATHVASPLHRYKNDDDGEDDDGGGDDGNTDSTDF